MCARVLHVILLHTFIETDDIPDKILPAASTSNSNAASSTGIYRHTYLYKLKGDSGRMGVGF